MYAIVRTGGKQYQVSPGDIIQVEKLPASEGEEVALDQVLLVKNEDKLSVGTPVLENTSVKATVLGHGRGKKITVYKFKRRKQYRRKQGHRQDFTRIKIEDIVTGQQGIAAEQQEVITEPQEVVTEQPVTSPESS